MKIISGKWIPEPAPPAVYEDVSHIPSYARPTQASRTRHEARLLPPKPRLPRKAPIRTIYYQGVPFKYKDCGILVERDIRIYPPNYMQSTASCYAKNINAFYTPRYTKSRDKSSIFYVPPRKPARRRREWKGAYLDDQVAIDEDTSSDETRTAEESKTTHLSSSSPSSEGETPFKPWEGREALEASCGFTDWKSWYQEPYAREL